MVIKRGQNELRGRAVSDEFEFEFELILGAPRKGKLKSLTTSEAKVVKFKTSSKNTKTFRLQDVFRYYLEGLDRKAISSKDSEYAEIFEELHHMTLGYALARPHATALAPLRTRPRRTYDELNEEFKPEGDHIPLVIARLLAAKQRDTTGKELDALMRFGAASGLFEKIDVKRMGRQPSDPFQVRVKMKGPDANLIDVGYGVSQSLPIVIDSIVAPNNEILLVQQPEVHLHPKAQAALGSFFAELVSTTSKQFIIETHSDYLIDRVRIAVADGTISAKKVQLLYLDREGLDIKVYALDLDDLGNITNAPPNYRSFFLHEEINLMSRGV